MRKRTNKRSKNKWIYLILTLILAILSLAGIQLGDIIKENKPIVQIVKSKNLANITITTGAEISEQFLSKETQNLKVYFFDVGQADSILVMNKEQTMLIDAGNNEDGTLLVENLKKLKVEKIDYLIGTHPHEDHIGGMDDIIRNFEIGTIYMPKVQTNTKTFEDVLDAILEKNLSVTTPKINEKFQIGEAKCEILAIGNNFTNLNLASIVIQMNFEELSYLFMGDAEEEIEKNLTLDKVNILKVGHHGSDTSSSRKFLQQITPELAVISVGKDNSYGHPNQEVINRFQNLNSEIYRTDEKGNILIEQEKVVQEKTKK